MLKKYRNGFIEIIEKSGYTTSQFKHHEKDIDGSPAFILQLENTPLYFMARNNPHNFHELDAKYVEFSPGYTQSDYYPANGWGSIENVYYYFQVWLSEHVDLYREEIGAPDLWEQLDHQVLFDIDPLAEPSENLFNKVEKQQVSNAIENFERMVKSEFSPSEEQIEMMNNRLEYLVESLEKQNKSDWQSIAISTLISISITLTLDTEKGKILFELFKSAFHSAGKLIAG